MPLPKTSPTLVAAFTLLVCLLAVPAQLGAQCNVINTNSFLTSAPATVFITKTLSAATSCMTATMMAFGCFPGAASFNTNMLYATRTGSSPNPYCSWSCGCGAVTIDGGDGLPVELMDFAVEGDEASANPEDENDGNPSD